jgi:hypothetical protein
LKTFKSARSELICRGLLLCVLTVAAASAQNTQPADAGVRRALLIGINDYVGVQGLRGSVNDVETMREVLLTRWGFSEANIKVLTDRAATRAAIFAALEELVGATGPNDTVYLHYSGHGSEVEDLNGDEQSGLDQTLVPQDGRTGEVRDIVDDELAVIIARLRARSAIIVLDSCHSGTATRSIDIRARSVPRDRRIQLYKQAAKTRAIVPDMRSRFVVLSATPAAELALDGPVDGRYVGFFSHSLAKSMSMAPPGATLKEVFSGVARELDRLQAQIGRASMPQPQLEGPPALLDQPLFTPLVHADPSAAAAQEARLPWLALLPLTRTAGRLEKGTLLGATVGSKWSIYPPGETQFPPGAALGVATIERLEGLDAIVRLESSHPLDPGSRAVALLAAPAAAVVPVRLMAMPAEQQARIKRLLASSAIVRIVGANESARFLIDMKGPDVRLLTADGLHVVGMLGAMDDIAAAELNRQLQRSINVTEILTLDNPASRLIVKAHVVGREPLAIRGITVVADTEAAHMHVKRANEERAAGNSLQLEVNVSADAYLTIVDVDSEGSVNLLFPNSSQLSGFHRDGAARGGEPVVIPDSLQPGNGAGFYWDYSAPGGTDTIRVFASTDFATANKIRQRILAMRASKSAGMSTRAVAGEVAGLREDFAQLATRDIVLAHDQGPKPMNSSATADWAATSLTVQVND